MKPLRIAYIVVTLIAVAAIFKYAGTTMGSTEPAPTASPALTPPLDMEEFIPVVMPVLTFPPSKEPVFGEATPPPDEPDPSPSPRPTPRPSPRPVPTPAPTYSLEVPRVVSSVDYDSDGVDDYTDLLLGARAEAERYPLYDTTYYEGGYPPEDIGVCTDLIWRAFRDAGYNLKEMMDRDIRLYTSEYLLGPDDYYDSNIDFRRVARMEIFFKRYCEPLTLDTSLIEQWQPGDLVLYDGHIGIASDIRRPDGLPYLIHSTDELLTDSMEEDALDSREILAHYRFDASIIPEDVLIPWE